MKYYGKFGFQDGYTKVNSIATEIITEREYYGDVLEASSNNSPNEDSTNDDIGIQNRISVIADPYLLNSYLRLRYVEYMGVKWKMKSIKVQYPRLVVTIGGIYHDR